MEKSGKLLVLAVLKPKGNYDDFGVQEIKSLFAMVGIDPVAALRPEIDRQTAPKPSTYRKLTAKCLERKYFVVLEIPHDQIHLLQEVVNRSVMVRTFLMLIGQGKTTEDLITKLDMDKFEKETASTESFCFFVTATLRSIKRDEQVREMEKFNGYKFNGKCNLQDPQRIFWLIQNWDFVEKDGSSICEQVFFGREIVTTNREGKAFHSKYSLSNRVYLGPTSTDHELAFLMVNQARLRNTDIALDPFVGTGSILVAASHFRALCIGTEIDYRVIRGMGVGRKNPKSTYAESVENPDVYSNFDQYGFDRPEILRMDCTNGMLRDLELFDAIVCDPPYGVRASARQTGLKDNRMKRKAELDERIKNKSDEEKANIEAQKQSHTFKPTKVTDMDTTVLGLFELAKKVLRPGGRLVFLFHIYVEKKFEEEFPTSEDFELIDVSENSLGLQHSRLLVTLIKKIKPSPPALTCN